MKNTSFFLVLLSVFLFFSCNYEDPIEESNSTTATQNDDLIAISFKVEGELSISRSQMKTVENTSDLFAVQIYDSGNNPYAYVVGDDISKISIDFKKGQFYRIKTTYVKNGKNLLYFWEQFGEWGGPFRTRAGTGTTINQVYYTSANELYPARASLETIEDLQRNYWGNYAEVERYYGVVQNFSPNEDNLYLSLPLKRMVFGLKLNLKLEDPKFSTLRFSLNGQFSREYTTIVTDSIAHLEIPYLTLGIPDCSGCAVAYDFALDETYVEKIPVSIGTTDHHTRFFDGEITVKRNKIMVINSTLKEQETGTGGFE